MAPIKGHYPYCDDEKFSDYLVIGPLCRYAKDLKLMMRVLCAKKYNELKLNENVDMNKLKVFYLEEAGPAMHLPCVQSEIKDAIIKCVQYLKTKGAQLNDYKFDFSDYLTICGSTLCDLKDVPNVLKAKNHNLFIEIFKTLTGHPNYSFNILYFYLMRGTYQAFVGDYSYELAKLRRLYIVRKFIDIKILNLVH